MDNEGPNFVSGGVEGEAIVSSSSSSEDSSSRVSSSSSEHSFSENSSSDSDRSDESEEETPSASRRECARCSKEARYCCPRCSERSCSLACCTAHKVATGCSGKRLRSEFVPLRQFTSQQLRNDLAFLHDGFVVSETAAAGPLLPAGAGAAAARPPARKSPLEQAAYRRGTELLRMPAGMSRRDRNRSRYDAKHDRILWDVEVAVAAFPGGADRASTVRVPDVAESETMGAVMERAVRLARGDEVAKRPRLEDEAASSAAVAELLVTGHLHAALRLERQPVGGAGAPGAWRPVDRAHTLRRVLDGCVVIECPQFQLLYI